MPIMMDDIQYFLTTSKTRNITRASEILGVSQPAISYAIQRLEKELGGKLLIRLKNGVRLSKLGEEFLKRSENLLHEWKKLQNIAVSKSGSIESNYTFAIHPSVALYSLKSFLPKLFSTFPNLKFNLIHGVSREMIEKVINWEADFGIIVNPVEHPDLVVTELCLDVFTIFYKEGAKNKLIYNPNLLQSQFIIKELKRKSLNYNEDFCTESLEVAANLTSLGLGYGILPTRVAKRYKELKILKKAPSYKDKICLVYRAEKHDNPISQKVIRILKAANI